MKKLIKILPILMTVIMVFTMVSPVFAKTTKIEGGKLKTGGYEIDPKDDPTGSSTIIDAGNNILGIIQLVGTLIAVGVVMVLGVKYMMGSAEEKAEYKKTFIPYIIGAVLLFAGVNIAAIAINLAKGIKIT